MPHKLNRARIFSCEVNFFGQSDLKGLSTDDQRFTGQRLHSQGGTLRYVRKSDGRSYQLRPRDKEYPSYETRSDFLYLSIRADDGPFIAYTLHDPAAGFMGLNLGWMSVACERIATDSTFKPLALCRAAPSGTSRPEPA